MRKTSSLKRKRVLVLGANGFAGRHLYETLEKRGYLVHGTVRHGQGAKKMSRLDVTNLEQVQKFPWNKFDVIVNCTGYIEYGRTTESLLKNIRVNTVAPLFIVRNLTKKQRYYHCSTYAATTARDKHNPYSLSKFFFEEAIMHVDAEVHVCILRLPALFGRERKTGLLHTIKVALSKQNPLTLSIRNYNWHTMLINRWADLMEKIIRVEPTEQVINIGYPLDTTVPLILRTAQKALNADLHVTYAHFEANRFVPNISVLKKYVQLSRKDFTEDLLTFFSV